MYNLYFYLAMMQLEGRVIVLAVCVRRFVRSTIALKLPKILNECDVNRFVRMAQVTEINLNVN